MGRCLAASLLGDAVDDKRLANDGGKGLLPLGLVGEVAVCSMEDGIPVDGGQFPVGLRLEMVDFLLSVDDQRQRGCLYTSDGEHHAGAAIAQGVEPCGVHAQEPVARGTGESGAIEVVVQPLVFQMGKTIADGLFRKG